MSEALLSVRGLSKSFGGVAAVQNVDMDLIGGVVTALVGPNGAGKTTLFNLVTGNIAPDTGEVHLEGRPITSTKPHDVARLGVARSFQDLRLFGKMTVHENVMVATEPATWLWQPGGPEAKRERLARVDEALERTGLAGLARARAVDLSYAETKFLSMARVIATGARIWLLDEPSSGLDPNSRKRFVRLIRDAIAAGVTICLIEHNLDIVTELADRIAFLDQGKKLAEGEPQAILRDPTLIAIYFGERRE
ncbi:MAG: ABC transporter ATP-binding protein [Bosea sp.]|uniref:ATP-binding cassette domain-containing protein n=1 Tax=Bosea sp. (in: a-proteobacteria) TaxID=1871050 RepID=UPI0010F98E91|nr:ABC transporter ATP-binding protein [Bosea sp. (in: a-proteobacteria)]MCP4734849.1 ABC transporter ATP-binding protein [Bosea sp. (in: a-proteobacteria)]